MGCEAAQFLESFGVVIVQQEGLQVLVEFVRGLVMVDLDGGLLNRAVQALDLAVGSGMGRLSQVVFYAVFAADTVKAVPAGQQLVRLQGKLHAVVGEYGMHFVEQFVQHAPQEFGGPHAFGARMPFGKGLLADAVDGHN